MKKILEKLFKFIARKIRNRLRYTLNGMRYRCRFGCDPRNDFQKKFDRWKYLEKDWVV